MDFVVNTMFPEVLDIVTSVVAMKAFVRSRSDMYSQMSLEVSPGSAFVRAVITQIFSGSMSSFVSCHARPNNSSNKMLIKGAFTPGVTDCVSDDCL